MTDNEINAGWVTILDCMLNEEDAPDGLLAELATHDKQRHDTFVQWLLEIGCAEVVHVPGQAH